MPQSLGEMGNHNLWMTKMGYSTIRTIGPIFVILSLTRNSMSIIQVRGQIQHWLDKDDRKLVCIEFYSLTYLVIREE